MLPFKDQKVVVFPANYLSSNKPSPKKFRDKVVDSVERYFPSSTPKFAHFRKADYGLKGLLTLEYSLKWHCKVYCWKVP